MGEVKIVRAMFGDEISGRNVTRSLQSRLDGGEKSVPVDSQLLPMFQVGGTISLNTSEQQEIQAKAEEACGNANDTSCISVQKQNLTRQKLSEKENAVNSTANIVKGRRLTVTVSTPQGEKTFVVPEGQKFDLGNPQAPIPELRNVSLGGESWMPSISGTVLQVLTVGTLIATTFFYVFTVVATWRTFLEPELVWWLKYATTAAAIVFPGSGALIVIGWSALRAWKSAQQ